MNVVPSPIVESHVEQTESEVERGQELFGCDWSHIEDDQGAKMAVEKVERDKTCPTFRTERNQLSKRVPRSESEQRKKLQRVDTCPIYIVK